MKATKFPYLCPDHPAAQIRREWDRTRCYARLTGAQWEYDEPNSEQFFCATCGRELASEQEPSKEAS